MGFREPSKDDDFGAADEGRLLYFCMCVGDRALAARHLPHGRARWRRRANAWRVDDDVCGNRGYSTGNPDDFPSQSLLTSGLDGRPSSHTHHRPRAQDSYTADTNAPAHAAGAAPPEPDPGIRCGDGRGSGSVRRADRREIVVAARTL